jgi:hypothetical protein
MESNEIFFIVSGITAIIFTIWFFYSARERVAATNNARGAGDRDCHAK